MGIGVYIDGFNFYYRTFRNDRRKKKVPAAYKWLDLEKMAQILMPREQIDYVGYFTAPVDPQRSPQQARRQRAYLLALETLPTVDVVLGYFRWVHHKGTIHENGQGPSQTFWHWEEKGSDVNLAMRMVRDACQQRYDKFVLISNDSDLVEPVRMVVSELNRPVFQVSPDITTNKAFRGVASSCILLQPHRLKSCRLPNTIVTATGNTVTCPQGWR
jgi:uncharacterized LabA/DUF88 family protein